jgi:nucleotide-binding universal stress UspA family protein
MPIKKIVIGIDNSPYAEHAAKYGFDIAEKFNAKVGLVHIIEPTIMPTPIDPMGAGTMQGPLVGDIEVMDIQSDAGETLLERFSKKFGKNVDVTHFNEFGDTADGIISCAVEFKADLIVVGTHSRSGFDRLIMGSIDEHVVRNSEIPVLVVPLKEVDGQ